MATLIMLIGPPGCGKSYIANSNKNPNNLKKLGYQIHSSDAIRKELYGNEDILGDIKVFSILHNRIFEDLKNNKDVVYDATNVKRSLRKNFFEQLNQHVNRKEVTVVGVVFDIPIDVIKQQNKSRSRVVPEEIIDKMYNALHGGFPSLQEGFDCITTPEEIFNLLTEQNKNIEERDR